jgi:glycosyltransferase 2 family protein
MTVETTTAQELENPAKVKTTRAVVITWLRRALVLAVLAGAGYQLVDQWQEVSKTLLSLPWQSVVLSFALVFVGIWLGPLMWHAILSDLGAPIRVRDASKIYLVGQLGKYIPGSLWAFLLQMELAKTVGVTRVRSFTASLVAAGLGVVASLIAGLLGLPVVLAGHTELLWLFGLLPVGLVFLHPKPLTWLVSKVLKILRRPPLPHPLSALVILKATVLAFLAYVAFGAHLWLLANALGSPGLKGMMLCVGTMGFALTVGLLAFLLPSGIGAREVVIVAALATSLPMGQALALAVVSRLMFTIADLASAGGAALFTKLRKPTNYESVATA